MCDALGFLRANSPNRNVNSGYRAYGVSIIGNIYDYGAANSYGRDKFSPSFTDQIFTYSVFDEGHVDTDAVGKGWFVTDSCGIK